MSTLGVILARSGSVGLKNKHLLPLLGRPVIAHTFDHARASRLLSAVTLSTDCPEILRLARDAGLDTITRPGHLATADASVQDVLLHALADVESRTGLHADAIACLYGNVPVRGEEVIDRAIDLLHSTGCDSVRSFCPVGKWHPAWMCRLEEDRVHQYLPNSIHRRQDLEALHLHDGAIFVVSRAALLRGHENPHNPHAMFGDDRRAILTAPGETVEIDQLIDFFLTEAILSHRQRAGIAA